ncbi:max-binding protein MNT-like [Zingiber officinale]|uniref:max-binding protein MNT-like n=1 Tax=Zingiber officinale TaxID=94328 RepID=UPI001C4CB913|nr:max-binding protein MNT-like [Zingiber officinale]
MEEELLRAKEAEFLAAIAPPPSIEEPTPLAKIPSSSGLHETPGGSSRDPAAQILPDPAPAITSPAAVTVSPSASISLVELTSPGSSDKPLTEISTGKHPGRKLTRAPPPKRSLILTTDELASEDFVSWDEVRPLYEGLSIPEAIDRFSNKENKWWLENMGFSRLLHNLYTENEKLKSENKGLRQQVTELSFAEFSTAAKKQFETQIESLEAQFKLEQEQRKAQEIELSSLQKELEQLRSEKNALTAQNAKLQADFQSYKEQEKSRWEEWRQAYLKSPAFTREFVRRILKEGGYLPREPPLSLINRRRLNEELPSDWKGPFPNV